jgi:hypothetical protein
MRTLILLNGDMIITIPKEDWERQMVHLDSLEPQTQKEFEEITTLMNLVKGQPTGVENKPVQLKLVKG